MGKATRVQQRVSAPEKSRLASLCAHTGCGQNAFLSAFMRLSFTDGAFSFDIDTESKIDSGTETCDQLMSDEQKTLLNAFCSEQKIASTRVISRILARLGDSDIKSILSGSSKKTDLTEFSSELIKSDVARVERVCEIASIEPRKLLSMLLDSMSDGEIIAIVHKNPSLAVRFNERCFFDRLATEITPLIQSAARSGAADGVNDIVNCIDSLMNGNR